MEDLEKHKKALDAFKAMTYDDIPIGMYLVSEEGQFIYANRRLREILKIPSEIDIATINIIDFYTDSEERSQLLQEVHSKETNGSLLEKRIVTFAVNNQERYIQVNCRSLRDPESRQLLGYTGFLSDVTEEERYKQMFANLPVGLYRLDENNRLIYANRHFLKIHGYEKFEEIKDESVDAFYLDIAEAQHFHELIDETGSASHRKMKLLKKNGEVMLASVSAYRQEKKGSRYAGRQGAVIDLSANEFFTDFFSESPIGLYLAKIDGDKYVIQNCNQEFLNLCEFDSQADAIGHDIRELGINSEICDLFIQKSKEGKHEGTCKLELNEIDIKTIKGRPKAVHAKFSLLIDKNGQMLGHHGAVTEITQEKKLENRLREITYDIGHVFHTYSTLFIMVMPVINDTITYYRDTEPEFPKLIRHEDIPGLIDKPVSQLTNALTKFLTYRENDTSSKALSSDQWEAMTDHLDFLKGFRDEIRKVELQHPALRLTAISIKSLCSNVQRGYLSKETVRQLRNSSENLISVCSLIALYNVKDALLDTEYQVRELRRFILGASKTEEAKNKLYFNTMIRDVIRPLEEFANTRDVRFKIKVDRHLYIRGRESELKRAFGNIIHNAIKYSWHRQNRSAWVNINVELIDSDIIIRVENWGVPITPEEIEKKLLFQMGFRGLHSGDKQRPGTGLGLYDAKKVITRHDGFIDIVSRPATPHSRSNNFDQPFLTQIRISFPNI